ncbi:MAG: transketolase [Chloroflexi bacterium]|nr:transketolase [Chloroflexota bacterium]
MATETAQTAQDATVTSSSSNDQIFQLAQQLRVDSIRSTTQAGSGHPTSSMSASDVMAVLLAKYLKYDWDNPHAANNDHLILSKGHAAPVLYAAYKAAGAISDDEMLTLRKFGSRIEGHPVPLLPYVDVATGSLGQGLPIGVGIGLAGQYLDKLPYRVWVILGDSEMAEGSVWEGFDKASHYQLSNLTAIIDVNRLGQRGETDLGWNVDAYAARARAFGWNAIEIDGHDIERHLIVQGPKPEGGPIKAGPAIKGTSEPVRLPQYTVGGDAVATRKAYGDALQALGARLDVVAVDAEVSNSTHADEFKNKYPDRFFEMYIAEQQLVAAAVGLQVRGYVPFASTFAAFFSRAYDFVRMAAISRANIRLSGSHAGVSIGEDGPSQMAIEDLASMRAVHGSTVLYPSDATCTASLVGQMADLEGISFIRTTRANTPILYGADEQFPIGGSKVLRRSEGDHVTIIGAGITLHEALKAYDTLKGEGISARVIDLYSVKPVDVETLRQAARETGGKLLTVEDHLPEGGIGDAVLDAFSGQGEVLPTVVKLAVRELPGSGKPAELLHAAGIDADCIAAAARTLAGK